MSPTSERIFHMLKETSHKPEIEAGNYEITVFGSMDLMAQAIKLNIDKSLKTSMYLQFLRERSASQRFQGRQFPVTPRVGDVVIVHDPR